MEAEISASVADRSDNRVRNSGKLAIAAILILGALIIFAATALGLAAPFYPYLDIINHFRLPILLSTGGLFIVAWFARIRSLTVPVAIIAGINMVLAAAPLAYLPSSAPQASIRIATFNVWVGNKDLEGVLDFIKQSGADIVVLQEVDARLEAQLVPALLTIYPSVTSCARRNCGLVLLSKIPGLKAGYSDRTRHEPPLIWATFSSARGKAFTVTGLHLAYPFQPDWQVSQARFLGERFRNVTGTQILVGDFNLTPFSWKLNRLIAETELRRHATFGATWPSHKFAPLVLLDNLLATPDVKSAAASYGRSGYGSDHRPMIFDVAFD